MIDTTTLVGRILASTKRKNRTLSIVDIASDIQSLIHQLGGIQKASEAVGLSTGMLNQFLSVFKLPPQVQSLVNEKKIDSVALVFTLSKFSDNDIIELVDPILKNELNSQDLKVLLPFRRKHPSENILHLLEKVKSSKNIKVSVIRLPEAIISDKKAIEKSIKSIVGEENYVATKEGSGFCDIIISKQGETALREIAKAQKSTLQQFIIRLVNNGR